MKKIFWAALPAIFAASLASATPLQARDFEDFRGAYLLETGSVLSLSRSQGKLYAQVDESAPFEIVAAADNSFVARDGRTHLAFTRHANGSVSAVRMTKK